jgi:uncharacterized membrane protein YdjX (TVP38/TMEM64 family)
LAVLGGGLFAVLFFHQTITDGMMHAWRWASNRDQVAQFINGFGAGAPLVFMAIQVLQVVVAPVPGEATGFIGGYLFGTLPGFLYSSIALAVGSWINFAIGRYLGRRFVRRWIPTHQLDRFDRLFKRQGLVAMLILFVFPGFPKDYLCLFLGITTLPLKAFLLIASFGRMPGTLILSLQGEFLFEKNYAVFVIVFGVTILAAWLSIHYRENLYRWMEKLNGKTDRSR